MGLINKLGTQVRMADGREGTVVYNGLDGVGIKWGLHNPHPADFEGSNGNTVGNNEMPDDFEWYPEAMLRDPYKGADPDLEYVGENYEIINREDENEN